MTGCHIKTVGFFLDAKEWFILKHLTSRKALKGLLQNILPMLDVRLKITSTAQI